MNTVEVINGMMKENTGKHFLDSGNAYGRHWQRNQSRDFDKESETTINFSVWNDKPQIEVSHNTYHWLKERLEYNEDLDKLFQEFCEDRDDYDLVMMQEFPTWLEAQEDEDGNPYGYCGGIYGEGEPVTVNTYNHESLLDQTLQFLYFENQHFGSVVLLQIHGGADVRGGYTSPKVFTVNDHSELAMFDDQRGSIYCEDDRNHYWSTDDGYHWYEQGTGAGYKQLEEYEAVELEEGLFKGAWEEDKLCIKDGVGFCPCCGGKLSASFY